MKPYALICCAVLLSQGCFALHTVTKNGEPLTAQDTDFRDCYAEVAEGADFEQRWKEQHDDLARAWVGCLKGRGIRMQGGDHPITIGPAANHDEAEKDRSACTIEYSCFMHGEDGRPGTCQKLDEDCFGRKCRRSPESVEIVHGRPKT